MSLRLFAVWLIVVGVAQVRTGPLQAQVFTTITGQITEAGRGEPLNGILVEIAGTRSRTISRADGSYTLPGLPPGTHTVRFGWLGYRTHEATVTTGSEAAQTLDVSLEPVPIELGEIMVTTASRQPERVVESPAAVSVVEAARVKDLLVTDQVPLFVADLPGVQTMQTGLYSFNLNTRGFNGLVNRRMMVLIDGRDFSAPILGVPEWPAISILEDASSVELVRGPGSALYGANAFSGVLNVITPSVRQAPGTRITLGGGELSTVQIAGRHAFVSDDLRWGVRVQGGYNRSQTWDRSRTQGGDVAAEYASAVSAGTTITVPQPGYEETPLAGQTKSSGAGLPGPVTGEREPYSAARGSARVDYYLYDGSIVSAEGGFARIENRVDVSGAGRAQISRSDLPWARLGWAAEGFHLMAYYSARDGEQTSLSTGVPFADFSSRIHVEGQLNRDFSDARGSLVVGASFRTETIDTKGQLLAQRHDGRTDEYYGVFGQVGYDVARGLKVIAAGRIDEASLFDLQFAPKVGIVWTPREDHAIRATLNRAYLMPTPTERFLELPLGAPADLSAFEAGLRASPLGPALSAVPDGTLLTNSAAVPLLALGNETLGAEEVGSVEIGYKGQLPGVFLAIDVHYSRFDNFATELLPGVNPFYAPWTAPDVIPEPARTAVEDAVRTNVTGATRLPDGSTAIVFTHGNAGEADQWGIDLSAAVQVTDEVRVTSGYSYVSVDFKEETFVGGEAIPTNSPSHTGSLALSYESPSGMRARAALTLVDSYDFEAGTWAGVVPARQSVDLSFGYVLSNQLRANVSATNLFDQRRFHAFGGSIIGRRVLASLTWDP